jgi:CRP/FNR family transcriptional regulator/CRP/FNR family cyclic AMP-dependent transcriptional regulator
MGAVMEYVDLLARVPLFASLKPDRLNELAAKLKPRSYRRGETIFHQDDPAATIHIIKRGQVKINTTSPEGGEIILAILTDGDFFGELSLLDQGPRSANAIAMEATQTLTLQHGDFVEIMSKHPEMMKSVMSYLAGRLRHADHRMEDAIFLDLPARLAKRLLELTQKRGVRTDDGIEIGLRLTQQDLAATVGVTRIAINRQLGKLQDMGLLSIEGQRIIIVRPDELKKRIY